MELSHFAQIIREQFEEDNIDSIEATVNFRTLKTWDSLTGMAILAVIKDDYGIEISVEEFKKLDTIEALFEYVSSRSNK